MGARSLHGPHVWRELCVLEGEQVQRFLRVDQSGFHYELSVHESAEMYITANLVSSVA